MKLLFFFTQQIAPNAGGVERVVSCMYEELVTRGYEIITLYLRPFHSSKVIPNQIQLPSPDGDAKINIEFIKELIQSYKFDISINFGAIFNRSSIAFVDACYSMEIPIISVYHNTLDWILWLSPITNKFMHNNYTRAIVRKLYSIYQKIPIPGLKNASYFSKKSAASVVLASCYKKEYLNLIDSKPNHLTAIYNPRVLFDSNDTTIKWENKTNEVLFIGRLEEQKNVAELIDIWSMTQNNGWKLIIVGNGSQRDMIETQIKNRNLSNKVVLVGHTDNPQEYYKRAKILAMTSKYEGFPMTLIECQSYGCIPIIYDSYPAASEIVRNQYNGLLIPFGQKKLFANELTELLMNEYHMKELSENGLTMSNLYSPDNIINDWIKLIKQHSK